MTIRIKRDRIEFTANGGSTYTLAESNTGFTFDGTIQATNIFPDPFGSFQGTVAGFISGGYIPSPPGAINTIDKFPFASGANSVDHGDLPAARTSSGSTGQSSSTHGYHSGGITPGNVQHNTILKYPFSTASGSSDIGDLLITFWGPTGHSSGISGYVSATYTGGYLNNINKFPFSVDSNATDVGDLVAGTYLPGGQSSGSHGYTSGGQAPVTPRAGLVSKFSFATDANATDASTLTLSRMRQAGQSSISYGYNSGGTGGPTNIIDKFPFAADASATDVGDLTVARDYVAGQSSEGQGYSTGGMVPPGATSLNTIDRFPFATDSNATDVADLSQARLNGTGNQE